MSWWNYEEVAKSLQKDYHIILPILDGHAESDRPFTTIEDNAAEIIEYIDKHLGGSVLLMGGLSLGGQILLEIFGSCYGLMQYKWFSKLQFKSLKIRDDLFESYYKDTCAISKKDMIDFLQANSLYSLKESIKDCTSKVHVFVGEKENAAIQKSAEKVHQALKGSVLQVLPGWYHGEFSINHGRNYANKIREIIGE